MAARLSILSSFVVGVVLVFAPWLPLVDPRWLPLWDANWLLQLWPSARDPMLSAWTRGAVTGIGLVNVLLALLDFHARLRRARPARVGEREGWG